MSHGLLVTWDVVYVTGIFCHKGRRACLSALLGGEWDVVNVPRFGG